VTESTDAEQVNRILAVIADSLESGREFIVEEAPELVQEFIAWKRVELTTCCAIGVVFLVLAALCLWRMIVHARRGNREYREPVTAGSVVYGILAIVSLFIGLPVFITYLIPTVQVWFAPKVFLIEYCAYFVR
jgi:hypothetical protein